MKFARYKCFIICSALSLLLACKGTNNNPGSNTDPVFNAPALKELSEKIDNDPENARLYFDRGLILHKLNRDTLALEDFKAAAKLDSTRAEYFSAIGDLMFEHKDMDNAVQWLQKALKLNPRDPQAHMKIAKMLMYLKDYGQAFAHINIVLRQDAINPEGYFLKGMIYKDLKDTTRALSSFLTALQVAPDYKDAAMQLGLLYSAKKNPIALKYFDNVFKTDTTNVTPLYAKGMYFQAQNQYEEAKAEYRNCIIYDITFADAYFNLGWILLQQDSVEKARRQFDLVTKQEPTDAAAYYNRGLCSEMLGQTQEALADYKQALTFDDKYTEAREAIKRLGSNK